MGVRVDEARIGDVVAELDDLRGPIVERQHVASRTDRHDQAVAVGNRLRLGGSDIVTIFPTRITSPESETV